MATQFLALLAVVTLGAADAQLLTSGIPLATRLPTATRSVVRSNFDGHPTYSYAYDVHDTTTGDSKSHEETRDGDSVRGSYSLVEPDGSVRTVDYTADAVNGFNAVVRKGASVFPPTRINAAASQPLAAASALAVNADTLATRIAAAQAIVASPLASRLAEASNARPNTPLNLLAPPALGNSPLERLVAASNSPLQRLASAQVAATSPLQRLAAAQLSSRLAALSDPFLLRLASLGLATPVSLLGSPLSFGAATLL